MGEECHGFKDRSWRTEETHFRRNFPESLSLWCRKSTDVFLDEKEWHKSFMNPKINGDLEGILLVGDEEKQLRGYL